MENSPDRFAYRCLPLNIANAHGWTIACSSRFSVRWNGSDALEALEFVYENEADPPAISHFGSGILTFHINAIVTTEPGVSILASGPFNDPRAHISPLTGIIETDWLSFTFTMNWKMTSPNEWVTFEKGAPFCMIFPVRLDDIEAYELEVTPLDEESDLMKRYAAYSASRNEFNEKLKVGDPEAVSRGWQKDYFQGRDDDAKISHHRTGLKLSKPVFRGV
ncbi:hypothetical protein MGEO_18235 [Marivita geojedonensis]|uniref:Uncharacterized protein n=2 Tax=Marivita geojedonensis TaxID=1123756 RepID=A0A1X4NE89_9RHOB|nr:hypothetical protein MGEO_18235 [Marivita geojedonensis]